MKIERCCLFLLAMALSGPAAGQEKAIELRFMSFNIRYGTAKDGENSWPQRRELVFDVIGRRAPDVVGLQEALRFQIDEIVRALPRYRSFGVGRDDGDREGEHAALLYRSDRLRFDDGGTFWFSDTPAVVASTSWGNETTRVCSWARLVDGTSGLAFTAYNVHLDHRSQHSRERSVELLARRVADVGLGGPFAILGDFNAGERNAAIRYLKGEVERASQDGPAVPSPDLVDTFRVLHPEAREVGTFGRWTGATDGEKIDYVLVPRWAEVLEAEIVRDNDTGRYPSDHYPVTARVRFKAVRES